MPQTNAAQAANEDTSDLPPPSHRHPMSGEPIWDQHAVRAMLSKLRAPVADERAPHIKALQDLRLGVEMDQHCMDDGDAKLAALDAAITALRWSAGALQALNVEADKITLDGETRTVGDILDHADRALASAPVAGEALDTLTITLEWDDGKSDEIEVHGTEKMLRRLQVWLDRKRGLFHDVAPLASTEDPKLPRGWKLALNLCIDTIKNAPPTGEEWPVNWPSILHGLVEIRDALDKSNSAPQASPVAGETRPTDRQEALRITELPDVDEALATFCSDGTQDNAVGLVLAILGSSPQASPVSEEAVYTLRVRGAIQAWTPTVAAFSIPDGEHQLFLSPAAPQASAEDVRIRGLEAARFAYASEFAPDENGDPDVGSIHANIRKLKAELANARNAALEEVAAAVENHQRARRQWIPESLWGRLSGEAAARIRALKSTPAPTAACDHVYHAVTMTPGCSGGPSQAVCAKCGFAPTAAEGDALLPAPTTADRKAWEADMHAAGARHLGGNCWEWDVDDFEYRLWQLASHRQQRAEDGQASEVVPTEPLRVFAAGIWTYDGTGQAFSHTDLDEAAFVTYRDRAALAARKEDGNA
ncbi:hypothetical protein ACLRAE_19715 [Bordetella bronchiseptica]|uniref:hypothetical protein n=1 Tax=Bordetella bronchiseptica TaxID=518 RepID=UPI00045998CE|nr:hypothetical protein [Bordetella bronchiseptica]KCV50337.1 hypothetical protein L492_3569 [Bordetella bronchiseptica 7E71]KDD52355.1 hypothetical protein L534_3624 [Bordetella bronchiseptica RB630]